MVPPSRFLVDNIVYKATVQTQGEEKTYIGLCGTSFKARWRNHKSAISPTNLSAKDDCTGLNEYLLQLKNENKTWTIAWDAVAKCRPYHGGLRRRCTLCLQEKLEIMLFDKPETLLNRRSEFVNKCVHQRNFLLCNVK